MHVVDGYVGNEDRTIAYQVSQNGLKMIIDRSRICFTKRDMRSAKLTTLADHTINQEITDIKRRSTKIIGNDVYKDTQCSSSSSSLSSIKNNE